MEARKEVYIGGRWVAPDSGGEIRCSTAAPKRSWAACRAAARPRSSWRSPPPATAFPAWSVSSVDERVAALRGIADGLTARDRRARRADEPRGRHADRDVEAGPGRPGRDVFSSIADILDRLPARGARRHLAARRARRPGWSRPSRRGTTRSTNSRPSSRPAIAAGCTTILKPAGVAPLAAFVLAEIIDELGLPAGTVNVVSGPGAEIGEMLSATPGSTWSASPAPPAPA